MPRFIDPNSPSVKVKSNTLSDPTIEVVGIIFTGAPGAINYHPLYDRQPKPGYPSGLNIDPPQWLKSPSKNEPIAYTRNTVMTVKADISGTYDTPIWVRITPSGVLTSDNTSINFSPSSRIIQVTDWGVEDYDNLIFSSSALPNEIRLDSLSISWSLQYGYSSDGPWYDVGSQVTEHQIYVTYDRPYYLFSPFYRPWKQVLHAACHYANGATTTSQASCMVVSGIYNSLQFSYRSWDSHSEFDNSKFELWKMLSAGWMDCMDGSNYYTVMMRWLGIPANQVKIDENLQGFYYKELRPISTSPDLDAGWQTGYWNFHQVGILTNIYDPIIMVDRTGTPRVPANMDMPTYKGYVFASGTFEWGTSALVSSVY